MSDHPKTTARGDSPITLTMLRQLARSWSGNEAADVKCNLCGVSEMAVEVHLPAGVLRCHCIRCGTNSGVFALSLSWPQGH